MSSPGPTSPPAARKPSASRRISCGRSTAGEAGSTWSPTFADAALGAAHAHAVEGVARGAELAVHLERQGVDLVGEDALLDPDAALVGLAAQRGAVGAASDRLGGVGQPVLGEAGAEPGE